MAALVHDTFCWKCISPDTTLKCSTCVRSFHSHCAANINTETDEGHNWICPVCVKLKAALVIEKKTDLQVLPIVVNRLLADKRFNCLKYPLTSGSYSKSDVTESVVNSINLLTIKENIAAYTSFEALLADVQWIIHNCMILFANNYEKPEAALAMHTAMAEEIKSIRKCAECYANAYHHSDSWFAMACAEPHLIIWAKMKGFKYWPAKLMSVDGQSVNVRFFGDHLYADVPATNCFLYAKTNPKRIRGPSSQYTAALTEADLYIENICEKFGSFDFMEKKTVLDPALLDHYILNLIPGVAEFRNEEMAANELISAGRDKCAKSDENQAHNDLDLESVPISERSLAQKPKIILKRKISANGNHFELKKSRTTEEAENQSQSTTNASRNDVSGPAAMQQELGCSGDNQGDTQTDSDSTELDEKCKQIGEHLQNVATNMVPELIAAYKSQLNGLKGEICGLKESHAKEIAAMKAKHLQMMANRSNLVQLERSRVEVLEIALKDKERRYVALDNEYRLDKQRASETIQRLEKKYDNKMNEMGKKMLALLQEEKSDPN